MDCYQKPLRLLFATNESRESYIDQVKKARIRITELKKVKPKKGEWHKLHYVQLKAWSLCDEITAKKLYKPFNDENEKLFESWKDKPVQIVIYKVVKAEQTE